MCPRADLSCRGFRRRRLLWLSSFAETAQIDSVRLTHNRMIQSILMVTTALNLRLDRGFAVFLVPIVAVAHLVGVENPLIPDQKGLSASC
jgi:hypothetical protein